MVRYIKNDISHRIHEVLALTVTFECMPKGNRNGVKQKRSENALTKDQDKIELLEKSTEETD